MNRFRIILYAAFAIIAYFLLISWQHDYSSTSQRTQQKSTILPANEIIENDTLLPQLNREEPLPAANQTTPALTEVSKEYITVTTDVLKVKINLAQGNIVQANLIHYPISIDEPNKPFPLLETNNEHSYIANSSIFTQTSNDSKNINFNFTSTQKAYILTKDQKELIVRLEGESSEQIKAVKEFIFRPGDYLVNVRYLLKNESVKPWQGYMNTQLLQKAPREDQSSIFHIGSYTGASYSNPGQHRYQKVPFAKMKKDNLEIDAKSGWVAIQQHYFLSAWIPEPDSKNIFYTRSIGDNYTIGAISKSLVLAPDAEQTISSRLYIGPEIGSILKSIAPGLDLTIDYGMLWFLSSLLFSLMKIIYSVVGNWGWAIVLVTVLIKLAFYKLSATSYKSMAGLRKLQPKIQALRDKYGEDKLKISQATMELYRQEKINPLGGCLPIIIQIPVFIALYWVLLESVELRQAPFILWINDLAIADPYHILPLIMGGTMLIQQQLNPAPPDPLQAKVMMLLPILFTALFWNFPAGLVLYWVVNNSLSILQQWYITRSFNEEQKSAKALARTSK